MRNSRRKSRITVRSLLGVLLALFFLMPAIAQDTSGQEQVPTQIEFALAALSQGARAEVTLQDLSRFEWSREQFNDTSLGCPRAGEMYAQVITPGYQFLLSYEGITYDYRVSEDGENVVLCDTRPAMPDEPLPTQEPPVSTCDDQYTVERGDTLIEIARTCNTTVAALMTANPEIDNSSLIFTGQVINIPDGNGERLVTIRPQSGPPGTIIQVYASGFPPGAQVQLGLGPPQSEYDVLAIREIGNDGELVASLQIPPAIRPPDERVAVVALDTQRDPDVTISEVFSVTEGQVMPSPTPTEPPEGALFEQTQMYLIALDDEGRSGQMIGCNDSVVPVTVTFAPTPAPLTAALEAMFMNNSRTYGQSGLYNVFHQSHLTVEGINIVDREAIINLTGDLLLGGVCDEPRVTAQIEQTALQYSTIDRVSVFLNGQPLEQSY